MNYDRIRDIFIDLYKELSETFDNFEVDFADAIDKPVPSKPTIIYVRESNEEIIEYFEKITQSKETAETFIKEQLAPAVQTRQRFDVSSSYHHVIARETKSNNVEVGRTLQANYTAFKIKLKTAFGIAQRDIHELIRSAYND
jgi:hypothetical protein